MKALNSSFEARGTFQKEEIENWEKIKTYMRSLS